MELQRLGKNIKNNDQHIYTNSDNIYCIYKFL
jgi:hypothetical protein